METPTLTHQNAAALRSYVANGTGSADKSTTRHTKKLESLGLITKVTENYVITDAGLRALASHDKTMMTVNNARIIAFIRHNQPTNDTTGRTAMFMPGDLQNLITCGLISASGEKGKSNPPSYRLSDNFRPTVDAYHKASLSII